MNAFLIIFLVFILFGFHWLNKKFPQHKMPTKDKKMPLVKGAKAKTKKGFSENIKREMETGKSQRQSVAIAYSVAGKSKKSKKKK